MQDNATFAEAPSLSSGGATTLFPSVLFPLGERRREREKQVGGKNRRGQAKLVGLQGLRRLAQVTIYVTGYVDSR